MVPDADDTCAVKLKCVAMPSFGAAIVMMIELPAVPEYFAVTVITVTEPDVWMTQVATAAAGSATRTPPSNGQPLRIVAR